MLNAENFLKKHSLTLGTLVCGDELRVLLADTELLYADGPYARIKDKEEIIAGIIGGQEFLIGVEKGSIIFSSLCRSHECDVIYIKTNLKFSSAFLEKEDGDFSYKEALYPEKETSFLLLSRFPQEEIYFFLEDGRRCQVKVFKIRQNGSVLLGVSAPPTVKILRDELYMRINEDIKKFNR
jgi:sRNA-binding carbon storage regulator CsrA